jgi:hypothetical protein
MTCRTLTPAALVLALGSTAAVGGQEPPRIEDIRAAWADRQAKAQSLRVEWKQTDFVVKGSHSDALKSFRLPDDPPVATSPPADLTYTSEPTLSLDGDKVAFAFLRRFWHAETNQYRDFPTEYKFAGGRQLALNRSGFTDYAQAAIQNSPRADLVANAWSVVRTFRGCSEKLRLEDIDDYVVTGAFLRVDGNRCYELFAKGTLLRPEERIWVDPARGCVAVRAVRGGVNRPVLQIDTKYGPDPTLGWVPVSWKMQQSNHTDGRLVHSTTATVTSCRPGPVEPGTFDFTLPAGTSVSNETGDGPRQYITKADGGRRVIGKADGGKTYDEILSTPGTEEGGVPWLLRWSTLAIVFGTGVALFLARIRLASRSRKLAPPEPPGAGV